MSFAWYNNPGSRWRICRAKGLGGFRIHFGPFNRMLLVYDRKTWLAASGL
jgi:hypothetical protein